MDNSNYKISVTGLGYVGLPVLIAFSKINEVVGFDINNQRINCLSKGIDKNNEVDAEDLINSNITFTNNIEDVKLANFHIVAVPTPVTKNNDPDLSPLISASEKIASILKKGDIVVYESTVYPGVTEEICIPILEEKSSLKIGVDFKVGYSPERINPGDKKKTLNKIIKVVSASNSGTLELINKLYESIIPAGTFKAKSISVAEAAKVIENTQRDVNIALINELALIFDRLNISTNEVLEAASTKWNFLPFKPGLVGGHCIGVDPYYLTHKAIEVGYHPEIIIAGRRINDNMGAFIAEKCISKLVRMNINPIGAKVALLGLTFKENCPDLRNTKVISIINKLKGYQCEIIVSDEWASMKDAKIQFDIDLKPIHQIKSQNSIIVSVGHDSFKGLNVSDISNMIESNGLLMDVKSIFNEGQFKDTAINYWRL